MTITNDIQAGNDIRIPACELSLEEYTDVAALAHACLMLTRQTVNLHNAQRMIEIYQAVRNPRTFSPNCNGLGILSPEPAICY